MTYDASPRPGPDDVRRALAAFVTAAGTRRSLPREFHVGVLGGEHLTLADDLELDAGLRADVVERALDGVDRARVPRPVAWITRSGELVPGDADFAWLAAALEAYGRHALELPGFFVITRWGWLDLLTDAVVRSGRVRRRTG